MVTESGLLNYKNSLEQKHRELDKQIETLYKKYTPDDILKEMKFKKLDLKNEIASIDNRLKEIQNGKEN
jgi:hypothetical protein